MEPRKPARAIRFWSRDMSFVDFGRNRLARARPGSSSSAERGMLVARTLAPSPRPRSRCRAGALRWSTSRATQPAANAIDTKSKPSANRKSGVIIVSSSSVFDVDQAPDDQRPHDLQEQRPENQVEAQGIIDQR